jgi:hypothetical protein
MFENGFDTRIKVSQIIENQIPEFILSENENFSEFLKQYYISQEYQGGPSDLSENLDQYLKLDNLIPEVISKVYTLDNDVFELDDEIFVNSTVGFPKSYGLLKIDDEIITYTGITTNSFTGCIRGFSGIESFDQTGDQRDLVFKATEITSHSEGSIVENLSVLFLKEFYKKTKAYFLPGLEKVDFVSDLNVGNFIKESKSFYHSKGTEESFRILFNILYGVDPQVVDLEQTLIKSSSAEYVRRKVLFGKLISGSNPFNLVGQTLISSDKAASGPISEIELYYKNNEYLYKISLFEGYDDRSLIEGEFKITPRTKVIGLTTASSTNTITVDSTIGFGKTGILKEGNNTIQYTDKSVNQFFNCTGIETDISDGSEIKSDSYVYSYENGDITKLVTFAVTGVLSDIEFSSNANLFSSDEKINIKNLGDYILNPETKTYKEFVFNSWIYNTSSRFEILRSITNISHITKESLDKSSIKSGDSIEIIDRTTNQILAYANVKTAYNNNLELVDLVNISGNNLELKNLKIDFRRLLKYASSSSIPLKYKNLLANVQNTYNENEENIYVATNSLPDYQISKNLISQSISSANSSSIANNSVIFSTISLPFFTGDEIIYSTNATPIIGLTNEEKYYVKVNGNAIQLHKSRSFIDTGRFVEILPTNLSGSHTFTLSSQYSKNLTSSKSLIKFPLKSNINNGRKEKTIDGKAVGVLINGVEISNYKGLDKIYYGPIDSALIYNSGNNYDISNPPLITVSAPLVSTGTTCLLQPIIIGSVKDVLLNQKGVAVEKINSITVSGGNGNGAILDPVIEKQYREIEFNAKSGVSTTNETITFSDLHNFYDGEQIVYSNNGYSSLGIGTFGGSNQDQNKTLLNGGVYYAKYVSPYSIRLHENLNDYVTGINTVGFTTIGNNGIHKFRTLSFQNVLTDIKVLDGGSGYQNKKLIVKNTGISTVNSSVTFKNHGFSDGDLVTYNNIRIGSSTPVPISGISTLNQYYVLKLSDDEFRLANAGVGGTTSINYEKKKYSRFLSTGTDYHVFNYPEISVNINVSYASTSGIISATPVVRGSIERLYVYDGGTDYGTNILNFHKKPKVTVKNGKNAIVRPVILNGKLIDAVVESVGSDYYSLPDLVVTGTGSGAKLKANILDGKILSVTVIKTGIGYDSSNTSIRVIPAGSQFDVDLQVRSLTINNQYRFGGEYFNRINDDEVSYQVSGYEDSIRKSFSDNFGVEEAPIHSPIIGWAFDGNPIYGPFGYGDPMSAASVRLLNSGYRLSSSLVENRPSLPSGIFVEDYVFDNSGDLDEHNGRYAKTIDFPEGVYAYFTTIEKSLSISNTYNPVFPYFIGDSFRSKVLPESNDLTQDFDFNNSNLLRNTFPYRIGQKYSKNEYINFNYDDRTISSTIDGISEGGITSFEILNSGKDYKVGDSLVFDNSNTSGQGASAEVFEIIGKDISNITTEIESFNESIVTKLDDENIEIFIDPYHTFSDLDYVTVTGISSYIKGLNGQHQIKTISFSSYLLQEVSANATSGIVTDIYVSNVPSNVSVGNSIGIGTETLSVLNVFDDRKIIRVKRGVSGAAHTASTEIDFKPNSFTIPISVQSLDSNLNRKIYFNPTQSIGVGTIVGVSTEVTYKVGELELSQSVQTQSIYLPNHGFKSNERVIIGKPNSASTISVLKSVYDGSFNILNSNQEYFYVVNKSKNFIGIKTELITSPGISTFQGSGPISGASKSHSGVLAPNGKIYAIPYNSSSVLVIDPVGLTTSIISGAGSGSDKWSGGVLAPNGKIYGIPFRASQFIEIDPSNSGISFYGSVGTSPNKWSGGVLAPNGKIYAIPHNSSSVLVIDPVGLTTSAFGSVGSDVAKWSGGVLAPNGKIYAIPYNSSSVLVIDPVGLTTSIISGAGSGSDKWSGGVLAPNGKIYAIPYNSSSVLVIDPSFNTISTFGNLGITAAKWSGGVLASNGKIYSIPYGATSILEIDPETETVKTFEFGSPYTFVSSDWVGTVLASNGKIIGIPYSSTSVLQVDINPPSTNGLLFASNGSDDYEYYIQPLKEQITAKVQKIKATISVSTSHNLLENDVITLNVVPNQNVGIGSSSSVRLKYDSKFDKILVNQTGFNSSGINTSNSVITISNHNFITGDKVFYDSDDLISSGLETGEYFVSKIDDNRFNLTESYYDLQQNPPSIVSIASSGGSAQYLSLINPCINVVKNNNLVFDISDSSLSGYNLKFFTDNNFINEFVSTGSSAAFSVVKTSTSARINSNGDINQDLYYTLEKGGQLVDADKQVLNYSAIRYNNSGYNGSYSIAGVGTTSFTINLPKVPERVSYASSDVDKFEYLSKSETATGGISKIKTLFGGLNYNKLPEFVSVSSTQGTNANIKLIGNDIGKITQNRIENNGFTYPSDLTLKPKAQPPQFVYLKNNKQVSKIEVTFSGRNYFSPPKLALVDSVSRERNVSGGLNAVLFGSSISNVEIVEAPKGLSFAKHEIYTLNNTNGVGINSVTYSNSGIVTCQLYTPLAGFSASNPPFAAGDKIFVEGIEKISGSGFNSEDYGFEFFVVKNYFNTNPASLEFDISSYTSNAGIAKTFQTYASIINYKNYPRFNVLQTNSSFIVGEKIQVNFGVEYIDTDLNVVESVSNYIKLMGRDILTQNCLIRGVSSGAISQVDSIQNNNGFYKVSSLYSYSKGWSNDIGKLNLDYQVLPDNDYYQNLSYTVKSPITFEEMIDPVNRMLHTTGLKNFADVGITSTVSAGVGNTSSPLVIFDFTEELRVDTINEFDLVNDYDVFDSKSKYVKFDNRKLTDYFLCKTNRVLEIDDISNLFSNANFVREDKNLDLINYPKYLNYSRFLVQTVGIQTNEFQLDDLIVLNNNFDTFTVNRGFISNKLSSEEYAHINGNIDEFGNLSLRFTPTDPNKKYKVKTFRNNFDTTSTGIGSTSIGFVNLLSRSQVCSPGITTTIVGIATTTCNSFVSEVFVYDLTSNKINFYEIAVDHDGQNFYLSQYDFDSSEYLGNFSTPIVSFGATISNNILSLKLENLTENSLVVKSKVINFSDTSLGIQTFRFKSPGQPDGSERSLRLESNYSLVSSASTIISVDSSTVSSFKSIVRIKNNEYSSLHQILFLNDGTSTYILPKYYISIGNTSGIGTFGSEISGPNAVLKFYPDPSFSGTFEILSYSEILYSDLDGDNDFVTLPYGTLIESIKSMSYVSELDTLDYELNYNETPIFQKTFNPTITSILNKETGEFFIENHFFSNNEEISYDPGSSFIGVGASPIGIGTTIVGGIAFSGDIISGFSTITGVGSSDLIQVGQIIIGEYIPNNTTIVSIGETYQYFKGNVIGGGSTVITGIANTQVLSVGSGIFSGDGTSLGTIQTIGISSITSSVTIVAGNDRLYYSDDLGIGISLSNVSTGTTFRKSFSCGIQTNVCPSTVYVIKTNNDKFKLTGTKNSGIGFTFTSNGEGNSHKLTMKKKNEKSLISVDGIIQYPILYTPISHTLSYSLNSSDDYFKLSGISSINPNDLLKIDNEYCKVINVGFGTTSVGPITGVGTIPVVYVSRGFVGSSSTNHSNGSEVRIYRGSYNIVGNKIHFTEAPNGSGDNSGLNNSNYPFNKSTFSGRVFLRQDYTNNIIYDEFSDSFNGIGRTYTPKYLGNDTTNIEAGSGLLFINQIFQTPTTANNQGNNYELVGTGNTTNIIFSGIRNQFNNIVVSDEDINQNQLPRGGIIISLGSTPGLGYAPLVGASVTAVVGAGGSIVSVGLGYTDVLGYGYRGVISIGVSETSHAVGMGSTAIILATVGAGGTLSFNVSYGGTGYTNPRIVIPPPSYENLSVVGVSRIGIGSTTQTGIGLSITVDVQESVGIVSAFAPTYRDSTNLGIGFTSGLITGGSTRTTSLQIYNHIWDNYNKFDVDGDGIVSSTDALILTRYLTKSYDETNVLDTVTLPINATRTTGQECIDFMVQYDIGPYYAGEGDGTYDINGDGTVDSTNDGGLITRFGYNPTNVNVNTYGVPAPKLLPTTFFEVESFKISNPGYAFKRGDVFKPVGLVTDYRLSSPINDFELTVVDVFTDSSALLQFGELDYIDSISSLQDGVRTRFPLNRNNQLLSFEIDRSNQDSKLIDFDSLLVIFINGIIQKPKDSYTFNGGTSFIFSTPPKPEDEIDVFFYRGTRNVDSSLENIIEKLKIGDDIILKSNSNYPQTKNQNNRVVFDILESDLIETNLYSGSQINSQISKPLSIIPQKVDRIINTIPISKSRDSLSAQIFPSSRIIKNISTSDTDIFVDDASSFNYEENVDPNNNNIISFGAIVTSGIDPVPAKLSATVSSSSTISSISIIDGGSGYTPSSTISLSISLPSSGLLFKTSTGIGIGTIAQATATISSSGTILSSTITNPGFGYTVSPRVIAPLSNNPIEPITEIEFVQGFSGIITGITSTTGIGTDLALKFFMHRVDGGNFNTLLQSYPFVVLDTTVGSGVSSIDANDTQVIGIGTEFLDNIYYVHSISRNGPNAEIIANVKSTSNIIGINTEGENIGRFSWGRLSSFTRTDEKQFDVMGNTISGLSTYPQIQRRNYGLRDTGAFKNDL